MWWAFEKITSEFEKPVQKIYLIKTLAILCLNVSICLLLKQRQSIQCDQANLEKKWFLRKSVARFGESTYWKDEIFFLIWTENMREGILFLLVAISSLHHYTWHRTSNVVLIGLLSNETVPIWSPTRKLLISPLHRLTIC